MPLHDFRCRSCGQVFEALTRADPRPEDDPLLCMKCGSVELERLMSAPAAHESCGTPAGSRFG